MFGLLHLSGTFRHLRGRHQDKLECTHADSPVSAVESIIVRNLPVHGTPHRMGLLPQSGHFLADSGPREHADSVIVSIRCLRVGPGSAKKGCNNGMCNIVPAPEQAIQVK